MCIINFYNNTTADINLTSILPSQTSSIEDFDSYLSMTAVDPTTSNSVIPSEVPIIPYIAVGVSAVVLLLIVCSSLIVLLIVIHQRRRKRKAQSCSASKDNG